MRILALLLLTGCAQPGDFVCTKNGEPTFIVEDVAAVETSGAYLRVNSGLTYYYMVQPGEVCAMGPTQ